MLSGCRNNRYSPQLVLTHKDFTAGGGKENGAEGGGRGGGGRGVRGGEEKEGEE